MNRPPVTRGLGTKVLLLAGTAVALAFAAFGLRYVAGPRGTAPAVPVTRQATRPSPQGPLQFSDVTRQTGVTFVHSHGGSGKRYIVETVSGSLALFDYDGDGDVDVYFTNGGLLQGTEAAVPPRDVLYRNDGNWHFTEVTEAAGLGDAGHTLGVVVGDYDNDGDPDVFLNNFGPNVLYRNNGDGTFSDVTARAGVGGGRRVGAGAAFLDMDADGDLDLFVGNYVKFDYADHVVRSVGGYPRYPGPRDFLPDTDTVYRNDGDGTFTDVTAECGVGEKAGTSMGLTCADYDNDGDTDVFVCNDVDANFLWENDGTGKFQEVALRAGTAYDVYGDENGSMGVDCGDYDNDGRLDFFMTDFQAELPVLYRNLGNGLFEDATLKAGPATRALPHVTWGTGFADFDNDGDRDLFIGCGHLHDLVDYYDPSTSYNASNTLLMNTGNGKFVDVSETSGDVQAVRLASRGIGLDDLDGDGDVDVVILNLNREPTLLRNDCMNANHWIQIRLRGVKTNRDGVGARVKVAAGDLIQVDEVHSGRGYQSHHGTRLHFGLGRRDRVDRIEVRWIGGGVEAVRDVAADQILTITEGSSPAETPEGSSTNASEGNHTGFQAR